MKKIAVIISEKKFLTPVFLIIIALLLYHGWLKTGVIARTDLFLPSEEWMEDNMTFTQLWKEEGGGRVVAIYEMQYYIYYLWAFLNQKLGISIDSGRRLLWFMPFFVGLFSMYFLSTLLFQSRIAAIVSTVYFIASNMTVWAAHVSWIQGITGLSLAPLVFTFFVKGQQENGRLLRNSLLSGLILSIIVWYDMKIAILTFVLLGSFSIFRLSMGIFNPRGKFDFARYVIRPSIMLAILMVMTILINFHTILPHILAESSGSPAVSGQPAYLNVSGQNNLLSSLLLTYRGVIQDGRVFPLFLAIISVTAFSSLVLCKRCPWVIFFALFSVVLIFLSKHTAPPFGGFNFYLYKYLPGFVGFRDPTKFILFQTLPISILLGASVYELDKRLKIYLKKTINIRE